MINKIYNPHNLSKEYVYRDIKSGIHTEISLFHQESLKSFAKDYKETIEFLVSYISILRYKP